MERVEVNGIDSDTDTAARKWLLLYIGAIGPLCISSTLLNVYLCCLWLCGVSLEQSCILPACPSPSGPDCGTGLPADAAATGGSAWPAPPSSPGPSAWPGYIRP